MTATPTSTQTQQLIFNPETGLWRDLRPDVSGETDDEKRRQTLSAAASAREELKAMLLSSLQMQHVVALAGSGTSLGPVGGPSMWNLWDHCVNSNPDTGDTMRVRNKLADNVIDEIEYEIAAEMENIEALLSRCDAYLQIRADSKVKCNTCNPVRSADAKHPKTLPATSA